MAASDSWNALLRTAERPGLFRYLHGMRHQVARGRCCSLHAHRGLEAVYHPTGRGVTRNRDRREFPFGEGDVVLYAPDEAHDQVMEAPGEDLFFQVALPPGAFPAPPRPRRSRPGNGGVLVVPAVASEAVRHDLHLLSRAHPRFTAAERKILDLRATAVLLELLHQARRVRERAEVPAAERHVREAERYLAEKFGEIGSLQEVATAVGIGYDHLRHSFRERRGRTLVRHLAETRVERARTLLAHSRLPLKQIATLCGFRDEYYFSTVFRRHAGAAPGAYRRARG